MPQVRDTSDIPRFVVPGYEPCTTQQLYEIYKYSKPIYTMYNGYMVRSFIASYFPRAVDIYIGLRSVTHKPSTMEYFVSANNPVTPFFTHPGEPPTVYVADMLKEQIAREARERRIPALAQYYHYRR